MSRSGYIDDCDGPELALYRGRVTRAIRGKRGQAFLKELAREMDAMPEKVLIANELIDDSGCCCAIGVVCKARGVPVDGVDVTNADEVGALVDIARTMAKEIEFVNDDDFGWRPETPESRWLRVRKWVDEQIIDDSKTNQ